MDAEQRAVAAQQQAGQRLAGKILKVKQLAQRPNFGIPVLAEDPPDDDPTPLWLLYDGRLRSRTPDGTVREYTLRTTPGGSSSTVADPDDPPAQTTTVEYAPTWAAAYCALHGMETGGSLLYGDAPLHAGVRIMIGLPSTVIADDLMDATVNQVELKARNVDSWAPDGVEIHWGTHVQPTQPADYAPDRVDVLVDDWPQVGYGGDEDGYHQAPTWLGTALQDGTVTGLTIDQLSGVGSWGQLDWTSIRVAITSTK